MSLFVPDNSYIYHNQYCIQMKYKVHRLEVSADNMQQNLEQFLNNLTGDIISVLPSIRPTFQGMGATAKIDYLLIVEKT
jgi:hypothetical protein